MSAEFLKKAAVKLEKKQGNVLNYPVKAQEKYISHFKEPKDLIERSFFQYKCQMKFYGGFISFFLNLASLPLSIKYLLNLKSKKVLKEEKSDAVFLADGKPFNIIPLSLLKRYKNIVTSEENSGALFAFDIAFLKEIFKRYPFSWHFWLKSIIKIARYSAQAEKHSPKALISCDEFSFTSSLLTEWCRRKNITRINVMHGEKLYFMRDSFVCYDEYFVWDKYYADLLISMRAEKSQFNLEAPPSVKIKADKDIKKEFDFTYYLAAEPESVLKIISSNLLKLKSLGYKISVRPHPRYADMKITKELFCEFNIEDTSALTIEASLLSTKNAISLYSSVLNQAYHANIGVVIDDISNPENFKKLKERRYIMLSVNHRLLSEIKE